MKIQTLTIGLLLFTIFAAKAQSVNYSGTWTRNTEQCDAGDLSINSIPVKLVIEQNSAHLAITRSSKNRAGDSTAYTEKPGFNSPPVISSVNTKLRKKSTVQWSVDGNELVLTGDYTDDQGKPVQQVKETWALPGDGKELVIKAVLTVNSAEHAMTEVFDKK